MQTRGAEVEQRTPPGGSPTLTLTVGAGAPSEKTWLVTRPITLIGSKRPAHILIHHPDVEAAHCVITTDGRSALLTDLRTASGTRCNGETCRTRILAEGDRVELGDARILVSFNDAPAGPSGLPRRAGGGGVAPLTDKPLVLHEEGGERAWTLELPVAVLGSRDDADVVLAGGMSQPLHVVIFRHAQGVAAFDLSPAGGMRVNGWPTRLTNLLPGDQLELGSTMLRVGPSPAEHERRPSSVSSAPQVGLPATEASKAWEWPAKPVATPSVCRSGFPARAPSTRSAPMPPVNLETVLGLSHRLEQIRERLTRSWARLNDSQGARSCGGTGIDRGVDLARRVAELDALDAALRGQLFDLTRAQEDLAECQNELMTLLRQVGMSSLHPPGASTSQALGA
ncbi:MAG: hypothetical protein FLDDKLPJ_03224 [Phycisphaerae bacterium]|nr:hypothetical protein [Phycisphaerae bacterium]